MRTAGFGLAVGLGLLLAAVVFGEPHPAGTRPGGQDRAGPSDQPVALSFDLGDGRQQVTVFDPRQQVMAVYHVDKANGAIALKSVRNVQWDLLMEEFNSPTPTPREIRTVSQQR